MLCKRCGSIDVVRTRSSLLDKVVRMLTGKKRVSCRHCLWTERVLWSKADSQVSKGSRAVDEAKK